MAKASAWHAHRDDQIVAAIDAGEDVQSVASTHRLTRTRILQIYRQAHPEKTMRNQVYTKEIAAQCFARWESGETYAMIAADVGVAPATVANWIGNLRHRRASAANTREWREPLDDSERYRVNSLLWDARRNQDWAGVTEAIEVLGGKAFDAYERELQRRPGTRL